jgi:hypothetical protein
MAKSSVNRSAARRAAGSSKDSTGRAKTIQRESGRFSISKARFEAVMRAARQSGLLSEKRGRIGGRVSKALLKQAKRQTGIESDTDLIEFALASVALEDNFADVFKASRGKVDRELKLGF